MRKITLGLLLISSIVFGNSNEKIESEEVIRIWLENVFKMKSHNDVKTRGKIVKKLLAHSRKNDIKYVNRKISQFWATKNRIEKRDRNKLYNKQTNFAYSFKTKYIKYDKWRKKILVIYTIFDYQNVEDNFNVIYLTKVNNEWKI